MAEHPERKELLRLLRAFIPPESLFPNKGSSPVQSAARGIRGAKKAVATIEKSRGVSTEEAVALLKQTGQELSAARKVIRNLGQASSGPSFLSTGELVRNILSARGSTQTSKGTQANLSPISEQVARFAATNEIGRSSGRLQVFATRSAATAAERESQRPPSHLRRNRPGR